MFVYRANSGLILSIKGRFILYILTGYHFLLSLWLIIVFEGHNTTGILNRFLTFVDNI